MAETKVGAVERFFARIRVTAIRITDGELKVADRVRSHDEIFIITPD